MLLPNYNASEKQTLHTHSVGFIFYYETSTPGSYIVSQRFITFLKINVICKYIHTYSLDHPPLKKKQTKNLKKQNTSTILVTQYYLFLNKNLHWFQTII